jgi:hypothetical protein
MKIRSVTRFESSIRQSPEIRTNDEMLHSYPRSWRRLRL